jgi:hypothetical protein
MTDAVVAGVSPDSGNNEASIESIDVDRFFESGGQEGVPDALTEAPAETKEPEPTAEKAEQKDSASEKFVPLAALHEERERRKEEAAKRRDFERQFQEERQRIQLMEQRFQQIMERANQTPVPNFEDAPLEHLQINQARLEKQLQQQNQTLQQRQEAEQRQHQWQQFRNRYEDSLYKYREAQPDLTEAMQYLAKAKVEEYQAAGYSLQQATQLLHEDETAIVANAFNAERNPAETIYKLAKVRGYKPASEKPADAQKKLDQLESGLKASKSLGTGGGKASDKFSIEAVAQMSNDEFSDFIANDKNWEKLMKQG